MVTFIIGEQFRDLANLRVKSEGKKGSDEQNGFGAELILRNLLFTIRYFAIYIHLDITSIIITFCQFHLQET